MFYGQGSSPRMWGALLFSERCVHRERIIPAYAGSTRFRRFVCS